MKFAIVSDVLSNIKTTTVLLLSIASACTSGSVFAKSGQHEKFSQMNLVNFKKNKIKKS